ncbi:hypothetical protein RvY_10962-2 [Ramazzottius varieornatus]|uniref:Cytochrome P450 n=1 Tax=Ramazzottius varieornatus TaxID=947166 RepID=A0A1D1VEI4_RAMVA|nr:hypothetical protein RvY_10962-2 [Ramazzottius varieornatus]
MLPLVISAFVVALVLILCLLQRNFVPLTIDGWFCKVPPGPVCWPLIGARGVDPIYSWITFTEWAKRYGGIFGLFLGSEYTVVLSDINLIRSALSKPSFEGRPLGTISRSLFRGKGLGFADGKLYREQRKFAVNTLHHLAVNSCQSDNPDDTTGLHEIYAALVDDFASTNGEPLDPMHFLQKASVLVSCDLAHKGVVKPDDPIVEDIITLYKPLFSINVSTGLLNIHPWLKHFPPYRQSYQLMQKAVDHGRGIAGKLVEQGRTLREKRAQVNQEKTLFDYASAFDRKMLSVSEEKSFTEEQLIAAAAELVMAGEEDIHAMMYWLVLFMCMYPDIQERAQNVLDELVGPTRQPSLRDNGNLDYIEAIVMESLRFSNFVPFPLPRRTTEDVQFSGFRIPKDTVVITNAYAVHFDEELWGDPNVFRPERFVDNMEKFRASRNAIAFGAGRRVCAGETFAKVQMTLLLSTILHNFTLNFAEGTNPPNIRQDIVAGLVMVPKPYQICATRRGRSTANL